MSDIRGDIAEAKEVFATLMLPVIDAWEQEECLWVMADEDAAPLVRGACRSWQAEYFPEGQAAAEGQAAWRLTKDSSSPQRSRSDKNTNQRSGDDKSSKGQSQGVVGDEQLIQIPSGFRLNGDVGRLSLSEDLGVPSPAVRALTANGKSTVNDLVGMTLSELATQRGMGITRAEMLWSSLVSFGLPCADLADVERAILGKSENESVLQPRERVQLDSSGSFVRQPALCFSPAFALWLKETALKAGIDAAERSWICGNVLSSEEHCALFLPPILNRSVDDVFGLSIACEDDLMGCVVDLVLGSEGRDAIACWLKTQAKELFPEPMLDWPMRLYCGLGPSSPVELGTSMRELIEGDQGRLDVVFYCSQLATVIAEVHELSSETADSNELVRRCLGGIAESGVGDDSIEMFMTRMFCNEAVPTYSIIGKTYDLSGERVRQIVGKVQKWFATNECERLLAPRLVLAAEIEKNGGCVRFDQLVDACERYGFAYLRDPVSMANILPDFAVDYELQYVELDCAAIQKNGDVGELSGVRRRKDSKSNRLSGSRVGRRARKCDSVRRDEEFSAMLGGGVAESSEAAQRLKPICFEPTREVVKKAFAMIGSMALEDSEIVDVTDALETITCECDVGGLTAEALYRVLAHEGRDDWRFGSYPWVFRRRVSPEVRDLTAYLKSLMVESGGFLSESAVRAVARNACASEETLEELEFKTADFLREDGIWYNADLVEYDDYGVPIPPEAW